MGITFNGKVKLGNPQIKKGQAVNEYGDCFVFECVEDPFCQSTAALSVLKGGWQDAVRETSRALT